MSAPETEQPHYDPRKNYVDQQFEELTKSRTATLNRELVRMQGEGWDVRMVGDHLAASRREHGRSQLERTLLAVLAFLAIAYAAILAVPDEVASLPLSKIEFLGAAAVFGVLAAFVTRGQAASERHVTVSVDGQGRPFVADLPKRDL